MISPYKGQSKDKWETITKRLVEEHPLTKEHIITVILHSWDSIFTSKIGNYRIGTDIFPAPQVMGFFLHELIALELQQKFPKVWRKEIEVQDKDVVCITDDKYSIEIKTSSSAKNIYGNRSYSQKSEISKKSKAGYYIAINFEKFKDNEVPRIAKIRFGWIDHEDWLGQTASTGQQARLSSEVEKLKLLTIYEK